MLTADGAFVPALRAPIVEAALFMNHRARILEISNAAVPWRTQRKLKHALHRGTCFSLSGSELLKSFCPRIAVY